jgi:hypothetical protein
MPLVPRWATAHRSLRVCYCASALASGLFYLRLLHPIIALVAVKILKLRKEKLNLFASVVQQFGELHAPVEQDGKFVFRRLNPWSEARLDYDRTIVPPKKYFLPPEETLLRSRRARGSRPARTD